ncbi:unnamed protein product, partial [Discosporangium mesarthrocarpum]
MEGWLVRNAFLEELFGASMHVELVKRSETVLRFLARRDALSTHQLELLWHSTLGKHEAVVRVLCSIVVNLVPDLSPTKRLFLFSCVESTPFPDYTEQTLYLVYEYTVKALEAMRTAKGSKSGSADKTSKTTGADAPISTPSHPAEGDDPAASATVGVGGDAGSGSTSGGGGSSGTGSKGGMRRGQVVHCPERMWLGYGLLWRFVQDSEGETTPSPGSDGNIHPHAQSPGRKRSVAGPASLQQGQGQGQGSLVRAPGSQEAGNGPVLSPGREAG